MLVPALTGYIRRAREEKEYQTAATIYTAAQAMVTDIYGRGTASDKTGTITQAAPVGFGDQVLALAGVDPAAVDSFQFTYEEDETKDNAFIIDGGFVVIDGSVYTLTIDGGSTSWSAAASK